MKKSIRVSEPSPEMQEKIRRARCAIHGHDSIEIVWQFKDIFEDAEI